MYAIDPLIDPNGRAVLLRATLENDQKELRPGMFARVNLVLDRREDAILLPETAVFPLGLKALCLQGGRRQVGARRGRNRFAPGGQG